MEKHTAQSEGCNLAYDGTEVEQLLIPRHTMRCGIFADQMLAVHLLGEEFMGTIMLIVYTIRKGVRAELTCNLGNREQCLRSL